MEADVANRTSTARVVDIAVTVLLMLVSIALALAFFSAGLLWALDSSPNTIGFVLGVYGPILAAIAGVIVGIIMLVRDRSGIVAPFAAIVLSIALWWIGSALVAA
ncbi:hypothetical protein ASC59_04950 [Leifsonia sp. Root1293]|nr:hypothetical protein ASC59_04950 [Leifsonia sp. Root1293]KRA11432.1 hypothetical protein ASD61_04950 [Leifsonia sp. Root60]